MTYKKGIKDIILYYIFVLEDFGTTFMIYFEFSYLFSLFLNISLTNISNMQNSYHFKKTTFKSTEMMIQI